MSAKELEELSQEYATILQNIGTALVLAEDSLREVKSNAADAEQLLARLLSMRILSHNSDTAIARAGELLTLSPYVDREKAAHTLRRLRTI